MIRMCNVHKKFGRATILKDINLRVARGEFVLLIGSTGAGKTTLLKLLHFDYPPTKGWVRVGKYHSAKIKQNQIPLLRREVGFIFQDFKLLKGRTLLDNISFALQATGHKRIFLKRKALQALNSVNLGHLKDAMPAQLSGGEQQKASIARALANEPSVLLADEPLGNLDKKASTDLIELLKEINHNGTTIVMATHDEELANKIPCKTIWIKDGTLV